MYGEAETKNLPRLLEIFNETSERVCGYALCVSCDP